MNAIYRNFSFALVIGLTLFGSVFSINAQVNSSKSEMRSLERRIEVNFESFKISLRNALGGNTARNNSDVEQVRQDVRDLDSDLENYKNKLNNNSAGKNDVEHILQSASGIDDFLRRNTLGGKVDRDWVNLRALLGDLADSYRINWDWATGTSGNAGSGNQPRNNNDNGGYSDSSPRGTNSGTANNNSNYPTNPTGSNSRSPQFRARLSGTYRLDTSRSDNPGDAIERARQNSNGATTDRDELIARLESPEKLAIEASGRNVSMASTLADEVSFVADGQEKTENLDNGGSLRVRAALSGERLTISTSDDNHSDYSVTFEPADNGQGLRVTRKLTIDALRQPITVQSIYTKTSDIAQLDIYSNPTGDNTGNGSRSNRNSDYAIANDTRLVGVLQNTLSTKTSLSNDRFTLVVQSPSEYRGAIIEGYVSGVERAGKVSGNAKMTFNFQRIRFADGTSSDFAGFVESLKTADGKTIKVDNEGTVKGDSQTAKTVKRGALGAGIGAVIGAIAGGGHGAIIGATIGGAGGAGSVAIQDRQDLELLSGSEINIRASSPRS